MLRSRSRFFCWPEPRAGDRAAFFKAAAAASFWQAKKESLVVVTKHDLRAIYKSKYDPGAGADPIWSELESAPGPRTSGAGAVQKSGGSATLHIGTWYRKLFVLTDPPGATGL